MAERGMAATTASTMMKKGDFVELNYTGTLTQEKLVFDTTEEKIAKQQEIYNADATSKYKPAIICVGQNSIVGTEQKMDFIRSSTGWLNVCGFLKEEKKT